MPVVLDASAVLGWALEEDPRAEQVADLLLTESLLAVANFPLEVASSLQRSVRQGRIEMGAADDLLRVLANVPLRLDPPDARRFFLDVTRAARRTGLSCYDQAVLELAEREGASIATLDRAMMVAADEAGIELVFALKRPGEA